MRPGENENAEFQLPSHSEQNLSAAQSAEIIAQHFSQISQEYSPLNLSSLPPNVQQYLSNTDQGLVPILSTRDVENRIIKAKKPNGLVPGDMPKKLVKYCPSLLAPPVRIIFNKITESAQYPSQ